MVLSKQTNSRYLNSIKEKRIILCERMRANPALKQKDTVKEYKISKQAISDILKQEKMCG